MATHLSINRRAALKTAAAVLAASVPAMALAGGSDDAELLELGRRFEPLLAEFLAFYPTYNAVWARVRERQENELPAPSQASWREIGERIDREEGFDKLDDRFGALASDKGGLDWLVEDIAQIPATTLAGLVVKARASQFVHFTSWYEPFKELDSDKRATRDLVENVLRLAGQPLPQERTDLVRTWD